MNLERRIGSFILWSSSVVDANAYAADAFLSVTDAGSCCAFSMSVAGTCACAASVFCWLLCEAPPRDGSMIFEKAKYSLD